MERGCQYVLASAQVNMGDCAVLFGRRSADGNPGSFLTL
jgi:hypothetical protein